MQEAMEMGCTASGQAAGEGSGSLSCLLPAWKVTAEVSNECQEELSHF